MLYFIISANEDEETEDWEEEEGENNLPLFLFAHKDITNSYYPSYSSSPLIPGAKPQIVSPSVRAHLPMELRDARTGSRRISPSQHVTTLFGLVDVFQVSITQLPFYFRRSETGILISRSSPSLYPECQAGGTESHVAVVANWNGGGINNWRVKVGIILFALHRLEDNRNDDVQWRTANQLMVTLDAHARFEMVGNHHRHTRPRQALLVVRCQRNK